MGAAPPGRLTERSADTWAARRLKNDGFRAGFKSFLEENGLGEADLTRVLRESLQATKVVATASENGKITDVLEREDHTTRLRAVEIGWKLHGRVGPGSNNEQPVSPMKVVVLSQKDADMFRVFRGDGSLPETFQIAPEGIAEAVIEAEGETVAEGEAVDAPEEEVLPDEAGG